MNENKFSGFSVRLAENKILYFYGMIYGMWVLIIRLFFNKNYYDTTRWVKDARINTAHSMDC